MNQFHSPFAAIDLSEIPGLRTMSYVAGLLINIFFYSNKIPYLELINLAKALCVFRLRSSLALDAFVLNPQ